VSVWEFARRLEKREERVVKTTRKNDMHTIKAIAAITALMFIAGCSSNNNNSTGTEPPSASTSVAPGSIGDFRQNVGDRVYFDTDMSSIREDGRNTLAKQAEWLKRYTNYPITIEGKCDERGTREYNLALGERRANAARQYLVAQGIPASRIKTISYGKERPEAVGSDEGSWARNRVAITALE
jgi:peptidoglycan-associated lipoprotein